MIESETAHLQGMHVVQAGPREAPPVLLIHGSGASGAFWGPVVPGLAERRRVVRIDLPGCGQSPPAASYEVTAQADRVAALLDELGLADVDVVGHSSGGYVATALAGRRADLVRSLVLMSTGPSPDALLPQPAILKLMLAPPFGPLLWPRRSDAMIRKGINATAAKAVELPEELIAGVRNIPYRAFRTLLACNGAYLAERAMPERLAALDVPVFVIFGDADPRWEPSSARDYEPVAGRIAMLPGVGHLPALEAPEATLDLLLAFTGAEL
ncbi:alpha/beta fold hydrolase [Glycomyces paridis]